MDEVIEIMRRHNATSISSLSHRYLAGGGRSSPTARRSPTRRFSLRPPRRRRRSATGSFLAVAAQNGWTH